MGAGLDALRKRMQLETTITPIPEIQPIDRYLPKGYGLTRSGKEFTGTRAEIIESMYGFTPSRDDPHYADFYNKFDETFDESFIDFSKSREFKKQHGKYDSSGWQSFLDNQSGIEIASTSDDWSSYYQSGTEPIGDTTGPISSGKLWGTNQLPWDEFVEQEKSKHEYNFAANAPDDKEGLAKALASLDGPEPGTGFKPGLPKDDPLLRFDTWAGADAYGKKMHNQAAAFDARRRASADPTTDEGKSLLSFLDEYQVYAGQPHWVNAAKARSDWEKNKAYWDSQGDISKDIPPGKGGSPGQPYQPPVEDPKNPYVPAPGKKIAQGHPYVSDDSDLPKNWDGSGDWPLDTIQEDIDDLIGPSGGFDEAQLPTQLKDNFKRQQKANRIAKDSWTIGRPSSNRQTRIPTLTEGGGMNRQRQTFRIT